MVKSMSGFLFHSLRSISIFRSNKTVGSGTDTAAGESILGLPSLSPSSCSEEPVAVVPVSDSLSRDSSGIKEQ